MIITSHSWQLQTAFYCEWRLDEELTKNNSSHTQLSCNLERNVVKWLTLTEKQTEKEHTENDHFNLSSDNVYLLFVSFCRFHETFGIN